MSGAYKVARAATVVLGLAALGFGAVMILLPGYAFDVDGEMPPSPGRLIPVVVTISCAVWYLIPLERTCRRPVAAVREFGFGVVALAALWDLWNMSHRPPHELGRGVSLAIDLFVLVASVAAVWAQEETRRMSLAGAGA
jgi:hypothetical protein